MMHESNTIGFYRKRKAEMIRRKFLKSAAREFEMVFRVITKMQFWRTLSAWFYQPLHVFDVKTPATSTSLASLRYLND